ncbi:hypothetical protein ACOJB1_12550 [Enterococcus innesii]|uniref:hypothetical protein n=1 Tax=Enterococcus TaxID=1350 RepID=UPI003B58EAA2
MNETLYQEVAEYIDKNVLQSVLWDAADETVKSKAVHNAYESLKRLLPELWADKEMAVDDIAQQAIFILKIDDSFQRAEMGVVQMSIDGMTLIFRDREFVIAPYISNKYNISVVNGRRRRTASYRIDPFHSYRIPLDNSSKRTDLL